MDIIHIIAFVIFYAIPVGIVAYIIAGLVSKM